MTEKRFTGTLSIKPNQKLIFHRHFYLHFCWPVYKFIMWDVGILVCLADPRLYFVTQIETLVIYFFLAVFKQRLNDTFMQNWRERLEGSSRANFYNSITQFQLQPYLENINVFKYMQAFSKLRMSSHRLAIESGRWVRPTRIPIDERKCSLCQVLEDEYHFVLECNVYAELRYKYIPKHYWKRQSMYKFVELLNTSNMKILRNLSIYIYHAFQCRTEQLYLN